MERWLFLHKERKEKIKEFAYGLEKELGNYWDFSEYLPHQNAREPIMGYSLGECFKQKGKIERTVKLIIGQKILINKPTIRFAFRYNQIWSDFITEYTGENYAKTRDLFKKVFGKELEDYATQQKIE